MSNPDEKKNETVLSGLSLEIVQLQRPSDAEDEIERQ